MSFAVTSQILAALALTFAVIAFGRRLQAFSQLARPVDRARPKGNLQTGVLYAYTLGMAPWSKESTRRHAVAYLRGVVFHCWEMEGIMQASSAPVPE